MNKWIAQAVRGRRVERVAKHADEREERGENAVFRSFVHSALSAPLKRQMPLSLG